MIVKTWHVCLSGFTQKSGTLTGMMKLWQKLLFLQNPQTQVVLYTWRLDTWALAETIWLTGQSEEEIIITGGTKTVVEWPRVYIYAYSWGAGWAATRLINELRKRGIPVFVCVFADPVFRSPYLPDWFPFNPLTFVGKYPVRINDNVKKVIWFYQTTNRPRAHYVRTMEDDQTTLIEEGIRLPGVTHQYMDDDPRFHAAAMQVARDSLLTP